MDLHRLESNLFNIFGIENVKPYAKGIRVIVDYENMPYYITLRVENDKLLVERDAVDQSDSNYESAYTKVCKLLIQNKDILEYELIY